MTPADCPDCSARWVDFALNHDLTCPLGLAIDAAVADDREWFERHPLHRVRFRESFPSEQEELRHTSGNPGLKVTHVRVTQISSGVRRRHFMGPR